MPAPVLVISADPCKSFIGQMALQFCRGETSSYLKLGNSEILRGHLAFEPTYFELPDPTTFSCPQTGQWGAQNSEEMTAA